MEHPCTSQGQPAVFRCDKADGTVEIILKGEHIVSPGITFYE